MRNHIAQVTAAFAMAAMAAACTGRTTAVNISQERVDRDRQDANGRFALIGCVKPAPNSGEGKYILDRVVTPPGENELSSSTTGTPIIPRSSWVRLAGPDLKSDLGKQVEISGNFVDAPVGTTGQGGSTGPAGYVRWANTPGEVPLVAVESVKVLDGKCAEEGQNLSNR